MNKLRVKISILIGVISFLVAMSIGWYTNSVTSTQLKESQGLKLLHLSEHIADTLDREMLERYRELRLASQSTVLTNENSSLEEKRAFLDLLKNNYDHHRWIGYALPDGSLQVGSDRYLEGKNVKARPWLPAGLKGPYIGDVHDALLLAKLLPNTSGEAIYFSDVAFPVKNGDKTLGVLCTHLDWQWTRNIIRSIQKQKDVEVFLLSKDGLILVGPGSSERKNISEISKPVVQVFTNKKDHFEVVDWGMGLNYLTAHVTSKGFDEYEGFGWRVIVRKSVDQAYLQTNDISIQFLIASVLIGVIGAIIGMLFANKLVSRISITTRILDDFRDGKKLFFDENIENDELGRLYRAVRELYESLEKEKNLRHKAEDKVDISLKIFDQSIEGILITDKDNNIILTNKAFTDITGYSQSDVYYQNPKILQSHNTDESIYKNMWETLSLTGKWEGELENKRKDGSLYQEHLRVSTIKNEKGDVVYYLGTFNSSFK